MPTTIHSPVPPVQSDLRAQERASGSLVDPSRSGTPEDPPDSQSVDCPATLVVVSTKGGDA